MASPDYTSSQNKHVKNIAFDPPSSASIGRPNDNLGAKGVLRNRVSYSVMIRCIRSTVMSVLGHKENSHKEGTVTTEDVRHYWNVSGSTMENGIA